MNMNLSHTYVSELSQYRHEQSDSTTISHHHAET